MSAELIPSTMPRPERTSLLERDVLVLQGATACIFILGMGALLLAAQTPIHWQAGQLARLIGLLWAVPATMAMTYRHALQSGTVDDPPTYLARMRLVRRIALAVLLLVVPWAQWEWHIGANALFSADLLWPMALSTSLCWGVGRLADQVVQVWFLLHARDWEEVATLEYAGLPRIYPQAGMVDRGYLIRRLWLWWLGGGIGLAGLLAAHGFAQQLRYAIPFGWWVAGFLAYLVLGPLLIGQATRVRWRTQWQLDRVRITPETGAWGRVALSATLLALLGVGLLLGGFVLAHDAVTWACSLIHIPVPGAPTSTPTTAGATTPAPSAPIQGNGGGAWGDPMIVEVIAAALGGLVVLALGALVAIAVLGLGLGAVRGADGAVRSILWSRKQSRGSVSRWLVLAAALVELGHYGGWLLGLLRRRAPRTHVEQEAETREQRPRRTGRTRPTPLSSMQPAEAVVALYLRATDLAAKRGYPRRAGQTPHEHARAVAAGYPDAGESLQRVSDVFVEARFGEAPAHAEQVRRLAESWKLMRRTFRRASPHREG